jgi:hypothetical protein
MWYINSIIRLITEYIFVINLFEDINVANISFINLVKLKKV